MSAITLAITGAEALYADMGHFGRKPIARPGSLLFVPSLILYLRGAGALPTSNLQQSAIHFCIFSHTIYNLQ